MSEQFTGARCATITATVTFDAYLMPGEGGTATPEGLAARIAHELADTIAYRTGWTTDAEPGDAIVAVTSGSDEPNPPHVDVLDVEVSEFTEADPAKVEAQAWAIRSELS